MFKNKQIFIQGQFLHAALKTGRQKELVFFAICQMFFSHKTFNKSHIGKIAKFCNHEKDWVYKLINDCVSWGIMVRLNDKDHTIRLINNEEIQAKFGGKLCASAYIAHDILKLGVKAAIRLVRQIPNLSCAKSQIKGYERNLNRHSKSDARVCDVLENLGTVINGERIYTIKESKLKSKLDVIGLDNPLSDPTASISIKTGAKNSGVSEKTFIKDKRFLHLAGVCRIIPRYRELQGEVSAEQWETIKNDKAKHRLPHYARYNRGAKTIYRNLACGFLFPKHA